MPRAEALVVGLGGTDNIAELEPSATRLRVELHDPTRLNEPALRRAGAQAVRRVGGAFEIVVGPSAETIADEISDLLAGQ